MTKINFVFALLLSAFLFSNNLNAQCPTGQSKIVVTIVPDSYPNETSWDIQLASNGTTILNGNYLGDSICFATGTCLKFTIHDAFGDGICCAYGNGTYTVKIDGITVATGGSFQYSETTYINCPPGSTCSSALPALVATPYTAPAPDTWYDFTPAQNGMYEITTCGLNTCDTKIWVYDHCNNLVYDNTNIGTAYYDDNACGWQAKVTAALASGSHYYVRIGEANGGCSGGPINWIINYGGPVSGCMDPNACNYNPIATVDDGSCIYPGDPNCPNGPDLTVVQSDLDNSLSLDSMIVANGDCRVAEGCVNGYGQRYLIRFTTHIQNVGNQDYFIGNPTNNPGQFNTVNCHGHPHYVGYAEYDLFDTQGVMTPIGFKNGFCVLDLECSNGGTAQFGCGNMGISVGCGDIYSSGLDCQWIDITDVDTGTYTMAVKVNWDHSPDALGHYETDYNNNWAQKCIHITKNSYGTPSFSIVNNCNAFVDCAGQLYGNAQPDCNGICNGGALRGDLNFDQVQANVDVGMYLNYILGDSLNAAPCNDLNADFDIDVYDAAQLTGCINYGSAGAFDHCEFPYNLDNINDTTILSVIGASAVDHYVDLGIRNPDNRVLGYQFTMEGLTISGVQSLINPTEYPMTPSFSTANNLIIGLCYVDSAISKSNPVKPFVRVYYSACEDTVCIGEIQNIVSKNNALIEQVVGLKENSCISGLLSGINTQVFGVGSSVYVAPNPTSGEFDINVQLSKHSDILIEITNALGEKIIGNSYQNVLNKNISLSLKNHPAGVYFVNVRSGNEVMTKRIVLVNQ